MAQWEVLSIATLRLLWVQVMLSLKNNAERENSFSMTFNLFQSEELQFSNIIILPDVHMDILDTNQNPEFHKIERII